MKILGIETSCDDLGISIYDTNYGVIFNYIYNQSKIHDKFGGVVPNLASKSHLFKIDFLIKNILKKYKININEIDYIACTFGPGLIGSLIVGSCFSSSLSYILNIPCYPINHLEGHLFSPFININNINSKIPFIGLIISGGNTQFIKVNNIGNYEIIGRTLDDSIGEIFDKVAKMLNLKYPGGPEIYKLSKYGIKNSYKFPRPMINKKNINLSFSGLKTHIKKVISNINKIDNQIKSNISLELQNSISDVLIKKSILALEKFNMKTLLISGGVSSNQLIKEKFIKKFKNTKINIFFPKKEFCTDNASMIAYTCMLNIFYNKNFNKNKLLKNLNINVNPKWSIEKTNEIFKN